MITKDSKILVTGAKGQLGFDCLRELKERGYTTVLGIDKDELDITDEKAVLDFIKSYKPEVVMHNAAWTAVDKAEEMPEAVYKVNSLGPKYIAMACKEVGATMFFISSDYVFDGKGDKPFEVNDPKNGLSVYGKTKSAGEDFVTSTLDKYFIIRISWAFGINGHNFVKTMLKLAETHKDLSIVNDQIGSPTYTYDLSKLMCDMMTTKKYGIYHATNEGFCSWAEFAEYIFKTAKKEVVVHPVSTEQYLKMVPNQARRPLNSRLSKQSLLDSGFNKLPFWQDAVSRYMQTLTFSEEKKKSSSKRKILVTGANGYLGQGVVKQLLDDGNIVIATDFKLDHVDVRAKRIESNLFEVANPYEFFDKPDAMIHLAWRDGFKHDSDAHFDDLPKHYHFIKNMLEEGLPQIAVMGSMHEVGFFEGSINENTLCSPQNMYGIAKNTLREATKLLCQKNNAIFQWLRGYYIVGNSEFGCSIFSKITKAVKEGQKEFPFTMGQNQYDFLDYGEFCIQVASSIEQRDVDGIINICSGKPEKLADRVENFISQNAYNIKLKYGVFPDRPYDSKAVWGNNDKIQKIMDCKKQGIE